MNKSEKVVYLAKQYMNKYGMLDAVSAERVEGQLSRGEINAYGGASQIEISEALNLVTAMSYIYNPEAYDAGTGVSSPEAGAALLGHQMFQSPSTQSEVASILGEGHSFSQAVANDQSAQIGGNVPSSDTEFARQMKDKGSVSTGLQIPTETENPEQLAQVTNTAYAQRTYEPGESGENTQQRIESSKHHAHMNKSGGVQNSQPADGSGLPPLVSATASGNGYQRVAQAGMGNPEQRAQPKGTTTVHGDGMGGTYRGTTGTGDSRDSRTAPKSDSRQQSD
jgi:hypothetical protein